MQRRHSVRHLAWRGVVASVTDVLMVSGLYPAVPYAWRALSHHDVGDAPVRTALTEWVAAATLSLARPLGFLPLPGARGHGPRPIILLHGYAMNRANFWPLALRMRRAGLGPIFGFEYWTLGRTAAAARQLGWFVDEVRAATGAAQVDLVGHSMGGVVGRYYVSLAGGDGIVNNLVTIGSPHSGTDVSAFGLGHVTRELVLGSALVTRLSVTQLPARTRITVVWSRGDAVVPSSRQRAFPGAEVILYPDLGHVALLGSRRVAEAVIARLSVRESGTERASTAIRGSTRG
jgi:triacylglycerol esterase/lipase EstA (alpha/beta hydrolase family)